MSTEKTVSFSSGALPEKRRSLREAFLSFAVILPAAFLFALKNDRPHVFVITFVLLLLPLFRKRPLPETDRTVIYSITAGMVLTALPDLMVSPDDSRMGLFDILVRSSLALPFLVYMASLGGLFASSGRINGARAALALAGMLLCGDRFNSRDVHNTLLSFLDPLLHNYFQVYAVCAVLQGILLPFFIFSCNSPVRGESRPPRKGERGTKKGQGKLFFVLRMCSIGLFGLFVAFAYAFVLRNGELLRAVEIYFMRMGSSGLRTGGPGKSMLSRNVDLRSPLPPWFGQLAGQVLFRAKAGFPPGLLRGGVYVHYEDGRWLPPASGAGSLSALETVRRTGVLSFNTFRFPSETEEEKKAEEDLDREQDLPGEKRENSVELYLDALVTSGIVPMPGNAVRLDAVADSAEVSRTGVLLLKHWKKDGGVTFFVRSPDPESAFNSSARKEKKTGRIRYRDLLSPEEKHALTRTPPWVGAWLEKVFPGGTTGLSGKRKAEKIKEFLQKDFAYSLYVPAPKRKEFFKDPVLRFLEDTKKGHCELFASAAVLLCRGAGLPARYVTGFVCEEKSPSGEYYFCRLAHAWGEVYLPEEERWVTLEATPPGEILRRRETKEKGFFRKSLDFLKFHGQKFFASVRRGYFADAVLDLFLLLGKGILLLFTTVWGWCVILCFGALTVSCLRRRAKARKGAVLTEERRALREKWKRFEKRFSRLAGASRPGEVPLREFYGAYAFLPGLPEVVEGYEKMRFGPPEEALKASLLPDWEKNVEKLLLFMEKEGAKNAKTE
ncbi:MAG: transglutaminase domain-containing protein [Lentisphaeria bacterium]|nr:transglutaminase domain-containing protein [Lentisphaeria bacterium]